MITAIVRIAQPAGTTLEDATVKFEQSAPNYEGMPGLIRKYYLYDAGTDGQPTVGGVYLWQSRVAADAVYTDDWKNSIAERYGKPPEISYFDTPVVVDNS